MNIQAINNDYSNCNVNFGERIRFHRLRKSSGFEKPLINKGNKPKAKYDAQQVVMLGSVAAGVAQAVGGLIPTLINPDSLGLMRLFGVLINSGLITAVVGITEADKIADFLKKKGIIKE